MRKILIVDDNALNRELLKHSLCKEYDILEAENGEEALSLMHRSYKLLSAVLLDIVMPVMDGYEVLRRMRENAALVQIPVIMITANEEEDARVKALSLGANDFVMKPYNPDIIKHCLRNNIALRETASIVNAIQRDKLTGLYNRETFFDKTETLLREAPSGSYIMSCFDIDNFKLINDQYGAQEGDRILREIGHAVRDVIDDLGGLSGRISADNFAVVYPSACSDLDLLGQLQGKEGIFNDAQSAVFSVGRYLINDLTLPASAIYDRAYIAKQSVKGRYDSHIAYFDEAMLSRLVRDQQIIAEMDSALAARQFEVWFQPQYNHATKALIGAEALVRWRHPKKGLVPPGEFIPVFEQNGFVYELDKYVWEETCRILRRWLDMGLSPLPVSVNISRYDIFRSDLIEVITGFVERYELPVELLRLEITESAFAHSTKHIVKIVRRLIDYGFTVEIDDFGSGYSSLNTLKSVPAQVIKLDMRFLEDDDVSQRGGNIIESIVRMTKWLGMSIIAEGVEDISQADFLKSIGCSSIQGYLYARPMPAEEFERLPRTDTSLTLRELSTLDNLDNNLFWDPRSMDTLIFNSYVGGAAIFEFCDDNIELLRANDKFISTIGSDRLSLDDVLSLNWQEHLSEASCRQMREYVRDSRQSGEEYTGEFVFSDLGSEKTSYLRMSLRVIAQAENRSLVYCICENITAQRTAEQREAEAEEYQRAASSQLSAIIQNIGAGVGAAVVSPEGTKYIFRNDLYFKQLGYTREQYEAEVADSLDPVVEEDRLALRALMLSANKDIRDYSCSYRIIRRDGAIRTMQSSVSLIELAGVEQAVQLAVTTDITELRELENEREQTDSMLRFLNETAHELLAAHDPNEGIQSVLRRLMEFFEGSRAYIFEYNFAESQAKNTYEVCAEGVRSELSALQSVPLSELSFWLHAFDDQSYLIIEDVSSLSDSRAYERSLLAAQGISSLIAVPLVFEGQKIGFIGVDDPKRFGIERLEAIGDYMSVMLSRRDLMEKYSEMPKLSDMLQTALSVMMDAQNDFSFVKDKELKYVCASRATAELMGLSSASELVGVRLTSSCSPPNSRRSITRTICA